MWGNGAVVKVFSIVLRTCIKGKTQPSWLQPLNMRICDSKVTNATEY